jgi:hypothetical protein
MSVAGSQFTGFVNTAGSQLTEGARNAGSAFSSAIDDAGSGIKRAFSEIIDSIRNVFNELQASLTQFIDRITGGGATSEGEKIKGKLGATGRNIEEAAAGTFNLTGETGTIQRSPVAAQAQLTSDTGTTDILLSRILNALNNPINVSSSVKVDGQAFANIMLELSRRNARTA